MDGTIPIAATVVCMLTKEMNEGPFYLDGQYVRVDITLGKLNAPLKLTLTVVDDDTCAPPADALVELWHADTLGEYSGFVGSNGHGEPDDGIFLRGGVLTDAQGVASLTTIYPGWYRGRCVHINVKAHTGVTLFVHRRPRTAHRAVVLRRGRHQESRRRLRVLHEPRHPHHLGAGLHLRRRGRRVRPPHP